MLARILATIIIVTCAVVILIPVVWMLSTSLKTRQMDRFSVVMPCHRTLRATR